MALTDALGNLVRFTLLPGNRYDTVGVEPLIRGLSFDALLADKAFDAGEAIHSQFILIWNELYSKFQSSQFYWHQS